MGEMETAVAREREVAASKRGVEPRSPAMSSSMRKQSGEEEFKRRIQQARVHWEAEQSIVMEVSGDGVVL